MALSYELPKKIPIGATPPTAAQAARCSEVAAVYTGAALTTQFTLTTNFELSADDVSRGLPEVEFEALTADYYTENPQIASKTADTVVVNVTGTAATAFLRIRAKRPNTMTL